MNLPKGDRQLVTKTELNTEHAREQHTSMRKTEQKEIFICDKCAGAYHIQRNCL